MKEKGAMWFFDLDLLNCNSIYGDPIAAKKPNTYLRVIENQYY